MSTILSFRALHITRALSCEAWSDRARPAQHLLISIKLPLLVIQAKFIDIHKKTCQCDKLFGTNFGFRSLKLALPANHPSDGLLSIIIQSYFAKSDTPQKKCVCVFTKYIHVHHISLVLSAFAGRRT